MEENSTDKTKRKRTERKSRQSRSSRDSTKAEEVGTRDVGGSKHSSPLKKLKIRKMSLREAAKTIIKQQEKKKKNKKKEGDGNGDGNGNGDVDGGGGNDDDDEKSRPPKVKGDPFADPISTPNLSNFDIRSKEFKEANAAASRIYTAEQIVKDSMKTKAFSLKALRRMTGPQFIKATRHMNLINSKFSYGNALSVLRRITRQTAKSLEEAQKYEIEKMREQNEKKSGGAAVKHNKFMLLKSYNNDDDETSTNYSESHFDSDSDPDDYISDEEISIGDSSEEGDGEVEALMKAAEIAGEGILFPHFVEAIVRLSLKRYGPTVPAEIIKSWNEERYNYALNEDGNMGYDSDGSNGTEKSFMGGGRAGAGGVLSLVGGARGGRRLSRSVRRNSIGQPKRPLDDNQSSRASLAPSQVHAAAARRLSSSLNRRKSAEIGMFGSVSSRENTRIANIATRVKFSLETHFLAATPEMPSSNEIDEDEGALCKDFLSSEEIFILENHQHRYSKIFDHFAVEHSDKKVMDLCEFVFFLDTVGLIQSESDKFTDVDVVSLVISSIHFVGAKSHDLMNFQTFFRTLMLIAEVQTYDRLTDRKTRFVSFTKFLFAQVAAKTKINARLW